MMKNFRILLTALVASWGASPALAQQAPADAAEATGPQDMAIEGIAAIVNDKPISYSDVRERAQLLLLSQGAQPTREQIQQITSEALDQLIDEQLQLQEAAEYEVEIDSESINEAVDDMARQSGLSREELYQQLLSAGINPTSLEEQMRAEIAWRRIMNGLYGSRIRISENQISEQIERLKASSDTTQFLLSEIFLYAPDPESRAQAIEAAMSIRDQLIQGAPFQLAAQRFSSAPTAATGGDMGWMTIEGLGPERAQAVQSLEGPGLTMPVEVSDGVYLLAVRDRREPQESVSVVGLKRLVASDGERATLEAGLEQVGGCDDLDRVAGERDGLAAADLGRIAMDELASDAAARIEATSVGEPTEIFQTSGGPTVMFVCSREETGGNLPDADQLENRLFGQELSMISNRALRNLRREATIIRR